MVETIVTNTSVIISALMGKSGAGQGILRKSLLGEYKPLISNALFHEYEDVSNRQKIIDGYPLTRNEIEELLIALTGFVSGYLFTIYGGQIV